MSEMGQNDGNEKWEVGIVNATSHMASEKWEVGLKRGFPFALQPPSYPKRVGLSGVKN